MEAHDDLRPTQAIKLTVISGEPSEATAFSGEVYNPSGCRSMTSEQRGPCLAIVYARSS